MGLRAGRGESSQITDLENSREPRLAELSGTESQTTVGVLTVPFFVTAITDSELENCSLGLRTVTHYACHNPRRVLTL